MTKRKWADGALGNTPLNAQRLNNLESDLEASLVALARDPQQLFAGAVTYDADGAEISAVVKWPDGLDGTYSGTASVSFPGTVSAYTITRVGSSTKTYTQPAVTRDAVTGKVTNRPPIVVTGETVEEYLYPDPVAPSDLDAALVGKINDTSSDTRAALSAAYASKSVESSVDAKLDIDKSRIVRKVERAVLTKFPRPRAVAVGVSGTTIDLYQQVSTSKWWNTRLRSRTFANGGAVHQIEDQHIAQAFALVGSADPNITYAGGTWFGNPGDVRNARSAGCTATWTSPATATDLLLVTSTSTNGGLGRVSIDGSNTAANQCQTAQQVVDSGLYPNTILVANGGTLNPTDRVIDFYSASLVASTNKLLATGLTATTHTVVITSTAYYRVGGTTTDIRTNIYGFGSASGQKLGTTGTTATIVETISTVASAWEYALKTRITSGGTSEFLGNVHGYETETSSVIKVDGVTTTVADGSIVFPRDIVTYTRTTQLTHPDSAGAKVADVVTTYTLTRDGLTVDVTVTWAVAGWIDTAYLMMPLAGKNAGAQAFDRIDLLENASGPLTITGTDGTVYRGRSKSAAAWAWQSQGNHAIAMWADDVLGYTNNWSASGVIEASFEDRGGILTKLYLAKVATPAAGIPFTAGEVHTSRAHYLMARFDNPETVLG